MYDLVGFGALNLDFICELAGPAELPLVSGGEAKGEGFEEALAWARRKGKLRAVCGGGSAANTVFALSRMGFKTGFVGKVGEDEAGDLVLASLAGVELRVGREGRTSKTLIFVEESGERSILVFPGASDLLRREEIPWDFFREARFVHLSSFTDPALASLQEEVLASLPPEVKVSFDPGEVYAARGKDFLLPLLKRTQVFFANRREIALLTGKEEEEGAREILALGPEVVACKEGKKGARFFTREEDFAVPAPAVEAVDTTGAGDVFAAGFLAGLLLGRPLLSCARLAVAAAARSVRGWGRSAYPDRSFLISFLEDSPRA